MDSREGLPRHSDLGRLVRLQRAAGEARGLLDPNQPASPGVEVAHGIKPRGPRSLAPPKYQRARHPPTTFLGFADGVRSLLREAVDWSAKAHPSPKAA